MSEKMLKSNNFRTVFFFSCVDEANLLIVCTYFRAVQHNEYTYTCIRNKMFSKPSKDFYCQQKLLDCFHFINISHSIFINRLELILRIVPLTRVFDKCGYLFLNIDLFFFLCFGFNKSSFR